MQLLLLCVLQLYLFKLFTNGKKEKKRKKKSLCVRHFIQTVLCALEFGPCSLQWLTQGNLPGYLTPACQQVLKGKKKNKLYLFILYWSWLCCKFLQLSVSSINYFLVIHPGVCVSHALAQVGGVSHHAAASWGCTRVIGCRTEASGADRVGENFLEHLGVSVLWNTYGNTLQSYMEKQSRFGTTHSSLPSVENTSLALKSWDCKLAHATPHQPVGMYIIQAYVIYVLYTIGVLYSHITHMDIYIYIDAHLQSALA